MSQVQVLEGAEEVIDKLEASRVDEESQAFLAGEIWAIGPFWSRGNMGRKCGRGMWWPIRLPYIQPSGKMRPIDDARRCRHHEETLADETIDCVSAFPPLLRIKAMAQVARRLGMRAAEIAEMWADTGGEDMLDTYPWVPVDPQEGGLNIVAAWRGEIKEWAYQEVWGHVFGRSAAVNNFHRVRRWKTALVGRWLMVMASLCFDDATQQDLTAAEGRGQRYMRALFRMMGWPLQASKQVDLTDSTNVLGVGVRSGIWHGQAQWSVRQKSQGMIWTMLGWDRCASGDASKLRGFLFLVMTAVFGKVGRGGQQALVQRECSEKPPWTLSRRLRRSLEFLATLQDMDLTRQVRI
jgi:hypothetical protein